MQARKGSAKNSVKIEQSGFQEDSDNVDFYFWSEIEMQKHVGEAKAKAWIDSGKLEWVPDKITQNEELHMREYKIPTVWFRSTSGSKGSMSCESIAEATDKACHSAELGRRRRPEDDNPEDVSSAVKTEPMALAEKETEVSDTFVKNAGETLRRLHDVHLDITRGFGRRFCKNIENNGKRLLQTFEKLIRKAKDVNKTAVPPQVKASKAQFEEANELKEWGEKLGLEIPRSKPTIRKRKA